MICPVCLGLRRDEVRRTELLQEIRTMRFNVKEMGLWANTILTGEGHAEGHPLKRWLC